VRSFGLSLKKPRTLPSLRTIQPTPA
jgi:hypothetical protein